MALFFFVIGLEVRRELSVGELTDRRRVAAAAGRRLWPAWSSPRCSSSPSTPPARPRTAGASSSAPTPPSCSGALAVVGPTFSTQLRIFLLTLTVIDDIVAVTRDRRRLLRRASRSGWLALALAGLVRRWACSSRVRRVARGAVRRGGARAVAGDRRVGPAPLDRRHGRGAARSPPTRRAANRRGRGAALPRLPPVADARASAARRRARPGARRSRSTSGCRRRCTRGPATWSSRCSRWPTPASTCAAACSATRWRSPVTWGVVLGLVLGKLARHRRPRSCVGSRLGLGRLPQGVGTGHVLGGAALSGIGFTVSLLIADLAFERRGAAGPGRRSASCSPPCSRRVLGWVLFGSPAAAAGRGRRRPAALPRPSRSTRASTTSAARRRAADAGGVRRLRVPVLRQGHRRGPRAAGAVRRRPPLRLPPPAADRRPSARRAGRPRRARGRPAGPVLGHARPAVRPPGRSWRPRTSSATPVSSGSTSSSSSATSRTSGRRRGVRADVASAEASGARGTPTFFVNGRRHTGPHDAESLARALST